VGASARGDLRREHATRRSAAIGMPRRERACDVRPPRPRPRVLHGYVTGVLGKATGLAGRRWLDATRRARDTAAVTSASA
jgi:hypothetical protein